MKEKEFLDELSTFPEWKVFGSVLSKEIIRRMDEGELSDDYDSDDWYSQEVLEDVVRSVDLEDEIVSFIARLARMKYEYEAIEDAKREFEKTMEALRTGSRLKQ